MCLWTHPPAHDKASDNGDHGDAAEWTTDGPDVCSCTGAQPAVHCVGLQKHWATKDHQRRVLASRTIIVMNRRSEIKHHVPLDTHTPACVKASDSGKHREAAGWTTDVPEEGICAAAQPARRCFGLPKKWTTQQHQRRVQALTRTRAVSKRQEALKHLSHHARRTTTGTSSPLAGTLTEAAVWQ